MSTKPQSLDELIRQLPPAAQLEVRDFVEFLLTRSRNKPAGILKQNWAGGLSDLRQAFTALELQKSSLNWRGD